MATGVQARPSGSATTAWYSLSAAEVATKLGVDPAGVSARPALPSY